MGGGRDARRTRPQLRRGKEYDFATVTTRGSQMPGAILSRLSGLGRGTGEGSVKRSEATLRCFEGGDHCGRKCVGRGVAAEIRGGGAAGDRTSDAAIEQAGALAAGRDPRPLVEPVQQ